LIVRSHPRPGVGGETWMGPNQQVIGHKGKPRRGKKTRETKESGQKGGIYFQIKKGVVSYIYSQKVVKKKN